MRLNLSQQLSWKFKQTMSCAFPVPLINCWYRILLVCTIFQLIYIIYIFESKDESQTNLIEKFEFESNQMVIELEFEFGPCDLEIPFQSAVREIAVGIREF